LSFYTKEGLYSAIHEYKGQLGYDTSDCGIDMIKCCEKIGITIEKVPFKTKGLRGMAVIGDTKEEDIILLNSNRNRIEQNFDCGHEVVHLGLHRDTGLRTFNCIDKIYAKQDEYVEWQANEGAAELFVPYTALLPLIKFKFHTFTSSAAIRQFKTEMSQLFSVSPKVIEFRFESLKYEIHQFLNGVSIENLEILSISQQQRANINVKSLKDMEYDFIAKESKVREKHSFINFDAVMF